MRPVPLVLACALALLGAACAGGGAARPQLLTVPAAPLAAAFATAASAPAAPPASAPVLTLRRVELPEYLLSRHLRYRADAATLGEWPDAVWAERLEIGVTRELAAALRARLPGWTVCDGSCADGRAADIVLRVGFAPLDVDRAARRLSAQLDAQASAGGATRWRARQPIEAALAADTPQAHAQAIADALGRAADALAARLGDAP
jgi:uncharacterized lipoprotein YmbA